MKVCIASLVTAVALIIVIQTIDMKGVTATANILSNIKNLSVGGNQFTNCFTTLNMSTDDMDVSPVDINTDGVTDAILTYKTSQHCGSGGCIREMCVSNDDGLYEIIQFGIASDQLVVSETITNSMHDIEFNNDVKMKWNGTAYVLEN